MFLCAGQVSVACPTLSTGMIEVALQEICNVEPSRSRTDRIAIVDGDELMKGCSGGRKNREEAR